MIRNVIFSSLLAASLVACFDNGGNNTTPDAPTVTPDTPAGGAVIRVNDNITTSTTWEARLPTSLEAADPSIEHGSRAVPSTPDRRTGACRKLIGAAARR